MTAPKCLFLLLGFLLGSCGASLEDQHREAHSDAPEGADQSPVEGEIRLPLTGLRGLAFVRVGAPQEEGVWAPAEAVSDAGSVALVTAPATGLVRRLLVQPGETVRTGQAVAEIASAEIADLAARASQARLEQERLRTEADRERQLFAVDATSRRELEAAEAAEAAAGAAVLTTQAALTVRGVAPDSLTGTVFLTAPMTGTLEQWQVALGQGVEAGAALATLRDRAATRVRVELAPPGPAGWRAGSQTEVRRGDGTRWAAIVEGLPAGLTADTRRYPYLLRLTAGPFPSPGTSLEVRVPLATGIVLPQQALQIVEGDWGVFVREGEEVVFRRVRRGDELGGDVLVLAGLEPGVEVATEGAYLLRPLWLKRMGGGEVHAH